jgi:hypothetical protein
VSEVVQVPSLEVVATPEGVEVIEVAVQQGPPGVGPQGPQGDPGIIVSATEPPNPTLNQLWLRIPA